MRKDLFKPAPKPREMMLVCLKKVKAVQNKMMKERKKIKRKLKKDLNS